MTYYVLLVALTVADIHSLFRTYKIFLLTLLYVFSLLEIILKNYL